MATPWYRFAISARVAMDGGAPTLGIRVSRGRAQPAATAATHALRSPAPIRWRLVRLAGTVGFRSGIRRPEFCRSFCGHEPANYRREAGTDARKVADFQQVVRNVCLGLPRRWSSWLTGTSSQSRLRLASCLASFGAAPRLVAR